MEKYAWNVVFLNSWVPAFPQSKRAFLQCFTKKSQGKTLSLSTCGGPPDHQEDWVLWDQHTRWALGLTAAEGFPPLPVHRQPKARSNSLTVPAGISWQGRARWDSCTQQRAPDSGKFCAICSGHSRHNILCLVPSALTFTFLLFFHAPFPEASSPYTTILSPLFHSQSTNLTSQTLEMGAVSTSFLPCPWYLLQSSLTESFPGCPFNGS